ncbi:MAG TPA: C-terminal binding protein [Candidatus Dormibacteraeota bacterium]
MAFRVAVVDHRFPDLEPEAAVLAPLCAAVVDLRGRPEAEVLAEIEQADAILVGARLRLDAARLERLRCRAIVRYGIGVDNVDVEAARARGIAVGFVPDYCVEEVSTHALALLLALHRRLCGVETPHPIQRLSTLQLGVVGFGRIGRELARKALVLGLAVAAHDPVVPPEAVRAAEVEPLGLDELLSSSDFVSLHVPLTGATRHLLDRRGLALMKPGSILVNVGRGGLVDEAALAEALESGHLAAAGLDVTEVEPLPPDHRLRSVPNLLLTPHVAWYSTGAQRELQVKAAEEVARALLGEPLRNPA